MVEKGRAHTHRDTSVCLTEASKGEGISLEHLSKFPVVSQQLLCCFLVARGNKLYTLFAWLISHQPTVLFSQNKPVNSTFLSEQTSHQEPANSTFLSEQTSTSHQPPAKRTCC
jgi:hypothetical protein